MLSSKFDYQKMITTEKKNCNFSAVYRILLQFYKYTYLFIEHLCNKKIMNLIMYKSNIYVNNSKLVSIDNVSVLQLSPGPFYTAENLSRVDGF